MKTPQTQSELDSLIIVSYEQEASGLHSHRDHVEERIAMRHAFIFREKSMKIVTLFSDPEGTMSLVYEDVKEELPNMTLIGRYNVTQGKIDEVRNAKSEHVQSILMGLIKS